MTGDLVMISEHLYTREVITRHVRNRGDYITVENLFGETELINNCANDNKTIESNKKSRKKKQVY